MNAWDWAHSSSEHQQGIKKSQSVSTRHIILQYYSTTRAYGYKARVFCVDGHAARQLHDAHSSEYKKTLKLKVKLDTREAEGEALGARSLEPNNRARTRALVTVDNLSYTLL